MITAILQKQKITGVTEELFFYLYFSQAEEYILMEKHRHCLGTWVTVKALYLF